MHSLLQTHKDYFDKDTLSSDLKEQLNELKFNSTFLQHKLFQQPLPPLNFKDVIMLILRGMLTLSFTDFFFGFICDKIKCLVVKNVLP